MSDLVKRLRVVANDWPTDSATYGIVEAADRIEELEASVVRFERNAVKWRAKYYTARREALEEAARVADKVNEAAQVACAGEGDGKVRDNLMGRFGAAHHIAAAIRALMEKEDDA